MERLKFTAPAEETPDAEIAAQAAALLAEARTEGEKAHESATGAVSKAWQAGHLLVTLKTRSGLEGKAWEARAVELVPGVDYFTMYRCMRLARHKGATLVASGNAAQYKEVLIALKAERAPTPTPRKDAFLIPCPAIAGAARIVQWWRGGDAAKEETAETLQAVAGALAEVAKVAKALREAMATKSA